MRTCSVIRVLVIMVCILTSFLAVQAENAESTDFSESINTSYPVLTLPRTSGEIKDYVDTAAEWALKVGRESAIEAFNDPSGPFVNGDIYIYALDYNGTALALPFQPEKVGEDFIPLLDASGKPYTEVEITLAGHGGGYILYHYPYPEADQPVELKISYVRPVDDSYWIGAGIYTSEDLLISPRLRLFVDTAKSYAEEKGRDIAVTEFNDVNGSFIDDDLYIFAYDYNGTVLAWPYQPDQIGVNRVNATDMVGSHHVQHFLKKAQEGGGMVDYYSLNPFTNLTDLKISYVVDVDGTWMIGSGEYIKPDQRVLQE